MISRFKEESHDQLFRIRPPRCFYVFCVDSSTEIQRLSNLKTNSYTLNSSLLSMNGDLVLNNCIVSIERRQWRWLARSRMSIVPPISLLVLEVSIHVGWMSALDQMLMLWHSRVFSLNRLNRWLRLKR